MTWNYRVVEERTEYGDEVEVVRSIKEVYYAQDGKPAAHAEAVVMWNEDEDPMTTIDRFKKALTEPVLHAATDFTGVL